MSIECHIIEKRTWTLYTLSIDGKNEVREYLARLEKHRPDEHGALCAAMRRFAQTGPPTSQEKFRKEKGNIFALKASQQRAYGFFGAERHSFVFCLCGEKKRERAKPETLRRAEDLRREWDRQKSMKEKAK